MATVTMTISDPWVGGPDDERRALEALTGDDNDIHGAFEIRVDGALLPGLGYRGPDDVCMNEWVPQLIAVTRALEEPDGRHVYDEGEQGQPAYVFVRSGPTVEISVTEGSGGGPAVPEWQGVQCDANQFLGEVRSFLAAFEDLLLGEADRHGQAWLDWARAVTTTGYLAPGR